MANPNLRYWCELYRKHKRDALAVDIETTHYDGPISVVSMYRKKSQWDAELIQFTKGDECHALAMQQEVNHAKMLITFNGLGYDVPKLKAEYPKLLSEEIPVFDLYVLARSIGLRGGLKNMERVMGLKRSTQAERAEGETHRLWKRIVEAEDEKALMQLLEYAAYDVRNLFALADWLIEWAEAKMALEKAPVNSVHEHDFSAVFEML